MKNSSSISVLMFPWLAHGHISPYLELAKKLTERNFTVYLCTTSATLTSVKENLENSSVRFVELHLPTLPNRPPLPPENHSTNGLPSHLMAQLKDAFRKSSLNFYMILEDLKPDLLIYDFLQPWAPAAASLLNIPAVEFITSSATMTAFTLHNFKKPDTEFPYSAIHYRDYEILRQTREGKSLEKIAEETRPIIQCHQRAHIILVKSFEEIEGKYCNYLSTLSGKKIVAVGPLVQDPSNDAKNSDELLEWLDQKPKGSTIFVAFGSEYFLPKEEREEIAHGLELSTVNFIWVLRFPKGSNLEIAKALPEGFLERVGDRGKVIEGWAPQAKILNHTAVGGFVSHCGWSSILESMKFGVPIIAMPMHIDQPINARLVEEIGAGVEVIRDKNGEFQRKEIAAVIKQVLHQEISVKVKAQWLRRKVESNGEKEIDALVEVLVKLCLKKYGLR